MFKYKILFQNIYFNNYDGLNVLLLMNCCHRYISWFTGFFMRTRSFLNGRSSHRRCSTEKGVLKSFANFTGKHLRYCLLLINLDQQFCQKETPIFKNTYFEEHLWMNASECFCTQENDLGLKFVASTWFLASQWIWIEWWSFWLPKTIALALSQEKYNDI